MRVLVTGAGGYVGGRLVPVLLSRGHEVVASFSTRSGPADRWWLPRVDTLTLDVLDPASVRAAMRGVDAVVYLVHALADQDFVERDRRGARTVADAAAAARVHRLVYLSGLVPPVPEQRLSDHLASRLEVERILAGSGVPTVTARAAMVIGSGSTSFEVLRRTSERLPVQVVPPWLCSQVQPIAVTDVLELLAGAVDGPPRTRAYDVGGPDRMSYAQLMGVYADVARLVRPRLPWLLPKGGVDWAGWITGRMTGIPGSTVSALLRSLHHDMVCADESFRTELLPEGHQLVGVRTAMERALTRPRAGVRLQDRDPAGPLPGDPPWSGGGVYLFDGQARHRPRGAVDRLLLGVRRPW